MKKRKLIALGLAAALALALTACGAKLTGVGLPQEELKLTVGGTAALEPVFAWDGEAPAEDPAVTYTSADEAVATVDESGTVTGVAAGETTVTAAVGELSATQTVVVNIATETLTVEEMSLHLADGAAQAVVTVEPAELADQLTFKTGDEAIAAVDENGSVTPVKEGHTSLLVLAPDGTRAKAMITVWSGPKELTLTAGKTEVTVGGTTTVTAADETGAAVERLLAESEGHKARCARLEDARFAALAREHRGAGDTVLFEEGLSPDSLRRLCDAVLHTCGGYCACFSGSDAGGWQYAVGAPDRDLRPLAKEMNAALEGRGGGKPDFIQGMVRASRARIEAFFRAR